MHALRAWESYDGPLPTVEGCVDGITYKGSDDLGRTVITVQCSTCYRTYTDLMIIALRAVNSSPHKPYSQSEPFRRCADCIEADRLPDDADLLREQKRFRDRERIAVIQSDEWREQSRIESHMSYAVEQSRAAYRRMVEMIKQADERGMSKWNEVHRGEK